MTTPYIFAVTGTKGKSSVVQLLSSALDYDRPTTLRVDSEGAYLGKKVLATVADSMAADDIIPTMRPGRFLDATGQYSDWSGVAVLECTIGCSTKGLGYDSHQVGIFTNIFNDHVGKRLPTRADLAQAKSFIATHVEDGGSLVYNADEPLIADIARQHAPRISLVSFGMTQPADWTADDTAISYRGQPVATLAHLPWLIDSTNTPFVYNALAVAAALHVSGVALPDIEPRLVAARLDPAAGRMELLGAPDGVRVLLTFAHEAVSLGYAHDLARKLAEGGRVHAAVRIRLSAVADVVVEEFAAACVPFDEVVIYEKTVTFAHGRAGQRGGPVLQRALRAHGKDAEYIPDEYEALRALSRQANRGDVIVYVVNGDPKKSREIALSVLT